MIRSLEREIGDLVGPGADRLLGDDLLIEHRLLGPGVGGLVEHAVGIAEELGHFLDHVHFVDIVEKIYLGLKKMVHLN